ncbi:MAG: arylesterase [Myxococcales bacterium]|nr:arylesterase [Myxococcales bacterium]MCB9643608.1 arylesterase [Myxococcales bacterium]
MPLATILRWPLLFCLLIGTLSACKKQQPPPTAPQARPQDTPRPRPITKPQTVLFLGDSLTAGYQLAKTEAFPALIQESWQKAGKPWKTRNSGISGDTTAGVLSRLSWVLKPDVHTVFLAIGGNDGLRGTNLDSSRANLEKIITRCQKAGKTVVMAGIQLPTNYGPDYRKRFAEMYEQVAKAHKVVRMPFLLKDVAGIPALNLADGIHPNPKGHQIIAKNVLAFFQEKALFP